MRFLRSGWFIITILILLAIGWYAWGLDWLAERKWQAYVAEARARGVKFTLAELRLARVPESDDLLQTAVFRDVAKGGRYHKLFEKAPALVRRQGPNGEFMLPDWAQTRRRLKSYKLRIDETESDDARAVRGGLEEFRPLLDEFTRVQAASANWDDLWKSSNMDGDRSYYLVLRAMRLLACKAQADLAAGDIGSARAFLGAQMRLATCFESAPGLDAELFRQWGDADFRNAIYSGLVMQAWREEDLRAFLQFHMQLDALDRCRWAFETGRAYSAEFCEKRLGTNFGHSGRWNDLENWQIRVRSTRKRWWRINGEWMQRFFDEEMAGFDPARGTWSIPKRRTFDIKKIDPNDVDFGLVNSGRMFMEEFLPRAIFTHSMNKLAAIACALELHRDKHGEYPPQLERLVPEFLTALPNDPCGGKPFQYRRDEKEGYLLYSVGTDERDDGGTTGGEWNRPDWRWWAPQAKE